MDLNVQVKADNSIRKPKREKKKKKENLKENLEMHQVKIFKQDKNSTNYNRKNFSSTLVKFKTATMKLKDACSLEERL